MSKLFKMVKNSRLYFVRLCARSKGVESLIKLMSQEKKPFIEKQKFIDISDYKNNFIFKRDYFSSGAGEDSFIPSILGE